jgi:hypothetical protein
MIHKLLFVTSYHLDYYFLSHFKNFIVVKIEEYYEVVIYIIFILRFKTNGPELEKDALNLIILFPAKFYGVFKACIISKRVLLTNVLFGIYWKSEMKLEFLQL